ncbi:two-component system sensor histidine kinase [Microlunatus lacustris]
MPRLALDQLLEQLRDRADDVLATQGRLRGLLRANAVLASDLSLPSLLQSVVEEARVLLQAQYAAIVVMGANDRMDELVQVGMPASLLSRVQAHPSWREISEMLGPVAAAGEEQAETSYAAAMPHRPGAADHLERVVRVGDKIYGRLYLRKPTGAVFTEEDEEIATALAATAGVAMANASLLRESEQRHRWVVAASSLADELVADEPERPLEMVCNHALDAARADFATLTLPDDTHTAVVAAGEGPLAGETISHVGELRADARRTLRTGRPLVRNDYGDDHPPLAGNVRVGSVMMVPLMAGDHVEGALTVGRVAGEAEFSEADLTMAAAFATQAAVALAFNTARRVERRLARLEDRDRIAMDLHDHVVQELFAVGMGLEALSKGIVDPEQSTRIRRHISSLNTTIGMIRTRIFELQSDGQEPGGLQPRLLQLIDAQTEHLGYVPQLHFSGPLDGAAGQTLTDDVLAVTAEALSNCARHAHATSVTVLVARRDGLLTVTITDNGVGIGTATRSSGLGHMRRRAERHGGTCTFDTPSAGGTRVTWTARLDLSPAP